MTSEKRKMLSGQLYRASDPELVADAARATAWMARYNAESDPAMLRAMLGELLGSVGEGVTIRPPFRCDYGFNISVGDGVFMNFGTVILDIMPVTIGDAAQIGPNVQILAADHPRDPAERRTGLEFGRPIVIGANAWIGGGAIILPGVTVGEDAVVGAGAVVTRDVARGATVAGNPARPVTRRAAV